MILKNIKNRALNYAILNGRYDEAPLSRAALFRFQRAVRFSKQVSGPNPVLNALYILR